MVLVKVLKRRDGASVVVAIVVGLILLQFIQSITLRWSNWLSGLNYGQPTNGSGWKQEYLLPVVSLILSLLVLEVLAWIYILATGSMKKR